MFNWANGVMIPKLFPELDINDDPLHWYYRGFMDGYSHYRLGPPRLRQLRAKSREFPCDM